MSSLSARPTAFSRAKSAVLGALVALPLVLTTTAFAGERVQKRTKGVHLSTLAKKGERRDARGRLQAQYKAAERLHLKRLRALKQKRAKEKTPETARAIKAEQQRYSAQMRHLRPKAQLAASVDGAIARHRAGTLGKRRDKQSPLKVPHKRRAH